MVTSICLSSIQIFLVNLNGAAENGIGARVRAMLARCYGPTGMKKRPDSMKLFKRKKHYIKLKKRRFSQPLPDFSHSAARLFLTVAKIPSEFVGGQVVSWRLPPVSRRICQRQRVISFKGKRNGGLEMFFKTAGKDGISKMGAQNHLSQINSFFLSPSGADHSLCSTESMCANWFSVFFPSISERKYH